MRIFLSFLLITCFLNAQSITVMCPVMSDEKIDPQISTIYQGKKVYLCCKRCVKKFITNPQKYESHLPSLSPQQLEQYIDSIQVTGIKRIVRFFGKFHGFFVHFPIALFIAAVLAEILAFKTGALFFIHAMRFCLIFASISAIITVLSGLSLKAFAIYPQNLTSTLQLHQLLAISAMIVAIATTVFCEIYQRSSSPWQQKAYRLGLLIGFGLIMATGYLGGTLVYGVDHYSF